MLSWLPRYARHSWAAVVGGYGCTIGVGLTLRSHILPKYLAWVHINTYRKHSATCVGTYLAASRPVSWKGCRNPGSDASRNATSFMSAMSDRGEYHLQTALTSSSHGISMLEMHRALQSTRIRYLDDNVIGLRCRSLKFHRRTMAMHGLQALQHTPRPSIRNICHGMLITVIVYCLQTFLAVTRIH